jgi:hypothetical protein
MSTFPLLSTGAVTQYPFSCRTAFQTEVLKFMDGSEQRYSNWGVPIRRWAIQLDYLSEGELTAVRQFFRSQGGSLGTFSFTDPVTGNVHPSCTFDQVRATGDLKDVGRASITLVIRAAA